MNTCHVSQARRRRSMHANSSSARKHMAVGQYPSRVDGPESPFRPRTCRTKTTFNKVWNRKSSWRGFETVPELRVRARPKHLTTTSTCVVKIGKMENAFKRQGSQPYDVRRFATAVRLLTVLQAADSAQRFQHGESQGNLLRSDDLRRS